MKNKKMIHSTQITSAAQATPSGQTPLAGRLFSKDFTLVVIGQMISLFGNGVLRFALPLYLLRQTGSAALFGLISACAFAPMAVFSLVGGVLADRVDKRAIMVALDFGTAALVLVFLWRFEKGSLAALMLVTLMLLYSIQGTYQPAVQASIPALLPQCHVLAGSAVVNQVSALSGLLGPVLGGVLMSRFGLRPILLVSIACFTASAVLELFLHIPTLPRTDAQAVRGPLVQVWGDLRGSAAFCRRHPVLLHTMLIALLVNLLLSAFCTVGLPVVITQTLGLGETWMGFAEGAQAIGALLGGAVAGLLGQRLSVKKIALCLSVAGAALLPLAVALLPGVGTNAAYGAVLVCSAVAAAAATMASIRLIAYVQMSTPPELVGKVLSCMMAAALCAQPIGQGLYGVLLQGYAAWCVAAGAGVAVLAVCVYAKWVYR